MKMIAYLLAIICVIAAVMYFVMPAGQLPTFMPGYIWRAPRTFIRPMRSPLPWRPSCCSRSAGFWAGADDRYFPPRTLR